MPLPRQPYFVYVLWSATSNKFYIGITEDVAARLRKHNEGIETWSRKWGPWEPVWSKLCADYRTARKLENQLKRQKGGRGFYEMTGLMREHFRK
jgi:putative endonuclease